MGRTIQKAERRVHYIFYFVTPGCLFCVYVVGGLLGKDVSEDRMYTHMM